MKKVLPTCGHEVDVGCLEEPDHKLCQKACELKAPCGHKCLLKCGEVCDSTGCAEWVTSTARKPLCGHEKVYVLCGEKNRGIFIYFLNQVSIWESDQLMMFFFLVSQKAAESFLVNCQKSCGTVLECGHVCSGTCGQCLQGRLHQTCQKMCRRTLICGHKYNAPSSSHLIVNLL